VQVTSSSSTKIHLRVTGATRPFWLVLGESVNTGWKATVDGTGRNLGTSTLIDGFANGWLVQPGAAGSLLITLQWTPQTVEDATLVVSGLGALTCVALALWPWRRRRTQGAALDLPAPTLVSPFAPGRSVPVVLAATVAAGCGLVAAILVPQPAFIAIFAGVIAGVFISLVRPRARGVLGLIVVGFTAAAVGYILVTQASQHFPPGGWSSHFEAANVLVWVAVVFLGADLVVDLVRSRR
jgi:hypothetical protein